MYYVNDGSEKSNQTKSVLAYFYYYVIHIGDLQCFVAWLAGGTAAANISALDPGYLLTSYTTAF